MEELVSTEALEKEILEDARKKAERLLREADTESEASAKAGAEKTRQALGELRSVMEAKACRYRDEAMARLPLEKSRMKTRYIDDCLVAALDDFLKRLPPERLESILSRLLAKAALYLEGRSIKLRRKAIAESLAAALVAKIAPTAPIVSNVEDQGLAAPGLYIEAADGAFSFAADLAIAAEKLLDEKRGELARALCGKALSL